MATRSRVRSTSRKDSPLSPTKAPAPTIASDAWNQNKGKTRPLSRDITSAQHELQNVATILPSVNEKDEAEVPELSEVEEDNSSGLDASSTGSSLQELLDALDRDAIIDNLQNLYDDAINLISTVDNISDEALFDMCSAAPTNARLHKKFQTQVKRLMATRESYGTNHDDGRLDFIRSDLILHKIVGVNDIEGLSNGWWRPDSILHLANLALQVVKVLSPSEEVHRTYLGDMFNNFPDQFINIDHFAPTRQVFLSLQELHVEILTQFYIDSAAVALQESHFDPDKLLTEVFFDEEGNIKGASDPQGMSLALERSELIKGYFDKDSQTFIDMDGLKEQFPWSEFAVATINWTLSLKDDLEKFVESRGGAYQISERLIVGHFEDDNAVEPSQQLAAEVEQSIGASEGQSEQTPINEDIPQATGLNSAPPINIAQARGPNLPHGVSVPATGAPDLASIRSNLKALTAAKQMYAQRIAAIDSSAPIENEAESAQEIPESQAPIAIVESNLEQAVPAGEPVDNEVPGLLEDDLEETVEEEDDVIRTQHTSLVLEVIRRQKEQSNKENTQATTKKRSLLDPQPGAERVQWDNSYPGGDNIHPPAERPAKRSRHHVDLDLDDGDEFETDTRPAKKPKAAIVSNWRTGATRPQLPEVEEDDEEFEAGADGDDVRSRPRLETTRPGRSPPTRSPQAIRSTIPSSSQPVQSSAQTSSTSRAPLQQLSSSGLELPPSSAPARSNPAPSSSAPSSRRLPPSYQVPRRSPSRVPPASQEPVRPRSRVLSESQEPPSASARHADANQEAKRVMQMRRDLQQNRRPAQTRIGYSQDEVDRLMEMIALYGTGWARILKEDRAHPDGPVLQDRTQVQLKDKARNIKLDWLKAGQPLEPGFEIVSVGNSQLEKLRMMGVDYIEGETAARYIGGGGGRYDDDEDNHD